LYIHIHMGMQLERLWVRGAGRVLYSFGEAGDEEREKERNYTLER